MSTDGENGKKSYFPFDLSAFGRVKLAPGVTGKISYTTVCTVVGTTAVAGILVLMGQPNLGFALGVLAIGTAWLSNWQISNIAQKNPAAVILDGAEFVKWAEIQQAAKDPKIIEGETVPTANTSPPLSITSGGE